MSKKFNDNSALYNDALEFHRMYPRGKIGTYTTKPLNNQRDLSLAYTPGMGAPCMEIVKDESKVFEYTAKGNFVAVITNGTAVLGFGDLGPMAAKPVMEGKVLVFKRFADIDAVDIEVDTKDPTEFIDTVKRIGRTWGGINLEDIKAPECFIIERELKKLLDIPVFHDDQHGTSIVMAAGLLNATHITNRKFPDLKIVVNGAGAAAIACINLVKSMGVHPENVIMCDTKGVIYKGRTDGMNEWKENHVNDTKMRTLKEAIVGADVFIGLSAKGAVTKEMIASMAANPIIFAMANPDPEITPEEIAEVRQDDIVATGRPDYNNQINNIMGFPYIFRGALDVQATTINSEMVLAAVHAIADLARAESTDEIESACQGRNCKFGGDYIVPVPFDSRLVQEVPAAVAEAAMKSGVARKPIADLQEYRRQLAGRLNPASHVTYKFYSHVRSNPKAVIFVDGEEDAMIRAAVQWRANSCGKAILLGHEDQIMAGLNRLNTSIDENLVITNSAMHQSVDVLVESLYKKLQRRGFMHRDCDRLIKRDRNTFAAEMLMQREADAMVAGTTRDYVSNLEEISRVIPTRDHNTLFALSMLMKRDKVIFIADTAIHELPTSRELADIAIHAAGEVRGLGYEPRVAFISYSNFGNPMRERSNRIREAVHVLDKMEIDFEYDGEIAANVALNPDLMKMYPFCRLKGPANILIMPALHSANIATKLLQEFGKAIAIGPILCGLEKSVQILEMNASSADVFNGAILAAYRS